MVVVVVVVVVSKMVSGRELKWRYGQNKRLIARRWQHLKKIVGMEKTLKTPVICQ